MGFRHRTGGGCVHRIPSVGAFLDGQSALMLCTRRLRHISGTKWGSSRYLDMDLLRGMDKDRSSDSKTHECLNLN